MDSLKWKTIKEIFSTVVELPLSERDVFLSNSNEEIRAEVEKLLIAHEQADDFIENPFLIEQGVAEDETKDALIGKQVENYLILERIGTGGMGAVYLAERLNSDFKQKVALKIIKRGMDSEVILTRFATERRILSTLKHPNTAQLLDGGISSEGLPFFVMEYVDGKPLNQFCDENELALNERLQIFRQICSAVENAHKHLIIHRDLKPSNVLVTSDGIPKLLDFGIGKLLSNDGDEATLTATQGRVFTPEYASPEQVLGKSVTTATDVYSLGVILYELLSSHRPIETKGKTFEEIVKNIYETSPIKPSEALTNLKDVVTQNGTKNPQSKLRNPQSLRGDLDNIILKSLRKEPAERYGSVQEFSEDIRRHLNGLPVLARPQTVKYRFGKYVKRHKIGVLAATLVLFSLISGISIATWQAIEARRERAKAEQRFNQARELANLVIFDYDERIKSLSGTIQVREKIVQDTLEYLDRLANDSAGLPDLQRQLALAYQKVGSIQGDSDYLSNLGKNKDALESFRKAVSIQEKVANSNLVTPRDRQILARLNLYLAFQLGVLGDWEEQRRLNLENLPILEAFASLEPDNLETQDDLAKGYRSIGNMASHGNGTYPEAVENFQKALSIYEKLAILQPQKYSRLKAITEKNLGSAWQLKGNLDEAIGFYQRAFEYDLETIKAQPNSSGAKIDLSFSYRALGSALEKKGDYQNALENYQNALRIRETLLSEDPND